MKYVLDAAMWLLLAMLVFVLPKFIDSVQMVIEAQERLTQSK